ncbi:DUF4263 domain-containing protein [bacterium]|nr:DUF4263 domain-containing protein [bacterium]
MQLEFNSSSEDIVLDYTPTNQPDWLEDKLLNNEPFSLKYTFHLSKSDHIPNADDDGSYLFMIGKIDGQYFRINKHVLNTQYDVLIHKSCNLELKYFVVNNRYSVFKRLDELANQQIIISDSEENAIPILEFRKIIKSLPTSRELRLYVESRMTNVLSQYLEGVKDSGKAYEQYRSKREIGGMNNQFKAIHDYELFKYTSLLETLQHMLSNFSNYNERQWQKCILEIILLLYPKYIECIPSVKIKDYYSNQQKATDREIDLMLIDSNGYIDVIEIKKPESNYILSTGKYRDNFTPKRELSGTIMQVEKYLFHLMKWGSEGEKKLTKKYKSQIPFGIQLKISNPKAVVILGRDNDLDKSQLFDFEIIKRKYTNIMDIITYDDLIRRLEKLIVKFSPRNNND